MRMFGITKAGNSVCCHVHGFHPYFFVPAPEKFTKNNLRDFRTNLNQAIISDMKSNKDNVTEAVLDVQILKKSSMYGFQVSQEGKLSNSFFSSFRNETSFDSRATPKLILSKSH